KAKVVLPDGVVVSTEEGTPQGGPLSPLLSNIVLDELDRELAERGHRFVRYADDCNIYVRSERAGQRVMRCIVRFIEQKLRLVVIGFFGICTIAEQRKMHALDARIRRRLRALLLKQWRRKRTIVRKLVRLGASLKRAMHAVYGKGQSWWALSHAPIVDRALPP